MNNKLLKGLEGGTKQAVMRKRIITHYIYNGTSTITELAKELDLSVPTVTKFIDEMCMEGYLNDYGKLETTGGRHPSLYGLNPDSGFFMGVELCMTSINIGVINFKGDMVHVKRDIPFVAKNTMESLEEFCDIIREFMKDIALDEEKLLNINVNLIGRVNSDLGYSYSIFNLGERPLTEILS